MYVKMVFAIDWTTETVSSSAGGYTSLAIDTNGWPHISYFGGSSDLKYAYRDSTGWHITTIDATGTVGKWTSIDLDGLDYPHISYYDDTNDDLKYAYQDNNGWHIEVVDQRSSGSVGEMSHLVLDNDGNPNILYQAVYDNYRRLIYAEKTGSTWSIEQIDYDIENNRNIAVVIDQYNLPNIIYYVDDNLIYAYRSGSYWISETIETETDGVADLKINKKNQPVTVYSKNNDLMYAVKEETGWSYTTIANDEISDDYSYISAIVDEQCYIRIAYYTRFYLYPDNDECNLKYAYQNESGWNIEYAQYDYSNRVGLWCSIDLNQLGDPFISYLDETNGYLKFAHRKSYSPQPFTLLEPINGVWANQDPNFRWEACSYQGNGLSRYELWIDGAWNINVPMTQPFSKPVSPLSSGWHNWKVKAIKLDGSEISSNESWSVRVDANTPTAFNLISPTDNIWTNDRTPKLNWQGSTDIESGIKEYHLYIDGLLARTGIHPDSTSTTPLWDLSSGDHTWYIIAVDNVGNETHSIQTWTFRLDYSGPNSFSLLYPLNDIFTNDMTPTFKWKATSDEGIGLLHYQLWIDGSLEKDSILTENNKDTISITLDTLSALNHGLHTWYIKAIDKLGNYYKTSTRYLDIDIMPPQPFSILSPSNNSIVHLPTPNFTWQSTSDYSPVASGFAKYQLWIDSAINVDNITGITSAPGTALSEGYHSWFLKAYDKVGNFRNSNETWTVILDWNSPQPFELSSPIQGDTVLIDRPQFKWQASFDAGSGINKYQLWIDNVLNRDNIMHPDTSTTSFTVLNNGLHKWFIKAYDYINNSTQSTTIRDFIVNVDRVLPISKITYPVNGDTIKEIQLLVQGTASDGSGSGVDSVFLSIDDWKTKVLANLDSNGNWEFMWDDLDCGNYTIKSRAIDKCKNIENPGDSVKVYVKNLPPQIRLHLIDITLPEDAPELILISLDSVFYDMNAHDKLYFSYKKLPLDLGINVSIDKSKCPRIIPKKDWYGSGLLIFLATDSHGYLISDTMSITIYPVNDPHVFLDAMPDTIINIGQKLIYKYLANNADSDIIKYSLINPPKGAKVDSSTGVLEWTPTNEQIGTYNIIVSVRDNIEIENDTANVILKVIIPEDNMVLNPEFDDDLNNWSGWIDLLNTNVEVSIDIKGKLSGKNSMKLQINESSNDIYRIQRQTILPIKYGFKYNVNFWGVADFDSVRILFLFEENQEPWTSRIHEYIYLMKTPQFFEFVLDSNTIVDPTNYLRLQFGGPGNDSITIWIDAFIVTAEDLEMSPIIVEEGRGIPKEYCLNQNHPNPFNPNTTIRYQLPRASQVELTIYNVTGQKVKTLVNEFEIPGYYSVIWNASDVTSGLYLYRIKAGEYISVKKCLVIK